VSLPPPDGDQPRPTRLGEVPWLEPYPDKRLEGVADSAPVRDPQAGVCHAIGLLVLTLSGGRICAMTRFDNSTLPRFGLPRTLPT
jgi:hypothetical protein